MQEIQWKTGWETACVCDKETIKYNKTDLKQQVIDDIHFSACDFYILFYQNAPAQCVISVLRWAQAERGRGRHGRLKPIDGN